MTYNEKKRFLEGYTYSVRRIKGLQNELEMWATIATGITQKLKPVMVQGGSGNNKMEDCAIRIAEIEDKLAKEIEDSITEKAKVESAIMTIRDTRRRELIQLRYIHNMPVFKIAQEYNKSDRTIYKQLRSTIRNLNM